jgi:hypothetical protein
MPFFEKSFAADRFATAEALLAWRDELLLAGWKFALSDAMPARLHDLARVEVYFQALEYPRFQSSVGSVPFSCGISPLIAHSVSQVNPSREYGLPLSLRLRDVQDNQYGFSFEIRPDSDRDRKSVV